jgi:uroporphyrinogen-III synthase
LEALKGRGAEVFPVPVYKWALPEDIAPLKKALEGILDRRVAVLLITNAAQIDHVMELLERDGKTEQFKEACRHLVVASIGPTASERLRNHGLPVDLEPSHPKMGILVKEAAERASEILASKR